MKQPVTIAILGAGNRGLNAYAPYALSHPEEARVVAVAEPRTFARESAAQQHSIPDTHVFSDWRELLAQDKLADAVIIATQDSDHTEPALLACEKGYDILLEKPMATSEADCRSIVEAAARSDVLLAVCHVLRYTPYFREIRKIIESGILGQVVHVRHFEQVGYWHFAHSYVRGSWRNEALGSPVILAKSCHDLDILLYLLQRRCLSVASYGSLSHFRSANKPAGATERCLDCPVPCPYSAKDFYLQRLREGRTQWPLDVITNEFSEESVLTALRDGPYGRCVYSCDNDVLDHQVVMLEFEDDIHATFTLSAFTKEDSRRTEIFGSRGELRGDGSTITVKEFIGDKAQVYDFSELGPGADSGHMGGDFGVMRDFITAIQQRGNMSSSAQVSLESHLMAFACERSRKNKSIEFIS